MGEKRKKKKTEKSNNTSTTWLSIWWKGKMVEINGAGKIREIKNEKHS